MFGRVVGKEFGGWWSPEVHRLTVDTYAVQHPGRPERRSIQSVALHLIGLHLTLERGAPSHFVIRALREGSKATGLFGWLEPPSPPGNVTVADVVGATEHEDHEKRARAWAASAWEAWMPHHATVRDWAGTLLGSGA